MVSTTIRTAAIALTICLLVGLSTAPGLALGTDGKLRIGTVSDYPPFSYIVDVGEPAGFDIEIVCALCVEMSVDCELQWHEWEALIPELRAGDLRCDRRQHVDHRETPPAR